MEGGGALSSENYQVGETSIDSAPAGASYRYWVREVKEDAAPPPVPRKLTPQDLHSQSSSHLGSAWNQEFIRELRDKFLNLAEAASTSLSYIGWNLGGEEPQRMGC